MSNKMLVKISEILETISPLDCRNNRDWR